MSHAQGNDLVASDRNATPVHANPPTLPTPTENTDIDEILTKAFNDFYDYITEQDIIKAAHEYSTKSIFLEAKAAIEQKLNEARISELKQLEPPEQYEEYAKLMGSEHCNICGFNAVEFRRHIQDRIQALQASKEGK